LLERVIKASRRIIEESRREGTCVVCTLECGESGHCINDEEYCPAAALGRALRKLDELEET
jgi:hypothetical protein